MSMIMCMKIKEQNFPIISFAACVYLFTKVEYTRFTTNEWYFLVGSSTKVADRFPVAPTLSLFANKMYGYGQNVIITKSRDVFHI